MNITEVKNFLEENKDSEDVKNFLEGFKTVENPLEKLDKENVAEFVEKTPILKSFRDRIATQAIDTWKEKSLPKILEDEISSRFPAETEEQKEVRKLREEVENIRKEKERSDLTGKAFALSRQEGIPDEFINFLVAGADGEDVIAERAKKIKDVLEAKTQAAVESVYKKHGYRPEGGDSSSQPDGFFTKQEVEAMTPAEVNKNLDKINESMSRWEN